MSRVSNTAAAPWQLGPVSALAQITAAALIGLAADSVFLWPTTSRVAASVLYLIVPLVLAIRVGRGFPHALAGAAGVLGLATILATRALTALPAGSANAALVVAAAVSATGLLSTLGALFERRHTWRPDIVGQSVQKTHDFLRGSAVNY